MAWTLRHRLGTACLVVASLVTLPVTGVTQSSLPPEIDTRTVCGIKAHFGGEPPPSELGVPLEYGVQVLWFTFKGDKSAYVFKPAGDLSFHDWRFDIFSPGCTYVLLLQDRHGPYHIVATDRLKDYLTGRGAGWAGWGQA